MGTSDNAYSYVAFLASTVYFVGILVGRNEELKLKIENVYSTDFVFSFVKELKKKLTDSQNNKLSDLSSLNVAFKSVYDYFSNNISVEILSAFDQDSLELNLRKAISVTLQVLEGEERDLYKKQLFEIYNRYRLTDL